MHGIMYKINDILYCCNFQLIKTKGFFCFEKLKMLQLYFVYYAYINK